MSKAQQFAKTWIQAWNSHDMNAILNHYSEDIEITTPMIKMALGEGDGSLKGKEAVADYWRRALDKIPDLHFELYDVTEGVDSVALYYKSVMDKKAVEVMFFNEEGKVNKMFAHYTV
ncbi:nuclear transport factor 2 family protein [Elizabethkingia anophelis]|uniref:nuclear transport factor 2 family protein n=1 Tax=Elizabethkingia anophelis TaxID=1117645 RepID=UPI000C9A10BB|nr:nuclear transport factor 2 family protein [Elizabethkingia anophelis]MCT3757947.1 nuclear transport factor 2 family protein [Elizabethkingia anophelis]MCT3973152.1 nuclear transport factor 2 family protein [Elizabethkingia anophelis]MCT4003500.1 nuclear transport factor 2 family protein [Elizabethkingia anophelis]MCT4017519.1 nuclear transport factor 2 family protein [Elizabethkingia anophelis]MCT4021081.1 nuclear transport factor 2 family protein [Elizabethkingia anophelis]